MDLEKGKKNPINIYQQQLVGEMVKITTFNISGDFRHLTLRGYF